MKYKVIDIILSVLIYPPGLLFKFIRMKGVSLFPKTRKTLEKIGVFPIINHYYEPKFDYLKNRMPESGRRTLPGINWDIEGQLKLLNSLIWADELREIPNKKSLNLEFHFNNGSYESGDAEIWYQIIRKFKPDNIIEIGSGNSTLMALKAISKNSAENLKYSCNHICIEPYEAKWLESTKVSVLRKKLEDVDINFFQKLKENDVLFIDSSHIIRPGGDVLIEILEILPTLKKGVIIHFHDIFTPNDYLKEWVEDNVWFWNEQYLLEAFLSNNENFKIIAALNLLNKKFHSEFKKAAPYVNDKREPGSLYLRKLK